MANSPSFQHEFLDELPRAPNPTPNARSPNTTPRPEEAIDHQRNVREMARQIDEQLRALKEGPIGRTSSTYELKTHRFLSLK